MGLDTRAYVYKERLFIILILFKSHLVKLLDKEGESIQMSNK